MAAQYTPEQMEAFINQGRKSAIGRAAQQAFKASVKNVSPKPNTPPPMPLRASLFFEEGAAKKWLEHPTVQSWDELKNTPKGSSFLKAPVPFKVKEAADAALTPYNRKGLAGALEDVLEASKTRYGEAKGFLGGNPKLAKAGAAGLALWGLYELVTPSSPNFHSRQNPMNYIDGMSHSGFAGDSRRYNTDFGSPYQGPNSSLNLQRQGPVQTIDISSYTVEDADTIRYMQGGEEHTLRLAGIDAPEVPHDNSYAGNKVFQDQPHGTRSTKMLKQLLAQQKKITAVYDPTSAGTYGRKAGLLMGDDGRNLNLELVRQGAAAALPFGTKKSRLYKTADFLRAEQQAVEGQAGMWADPGWQAIYQQQRRAKRRATHNSFTNLSKMFGNFKTSSMVHRLRNGDSELAEMQAFGDRSDATIIEGLKHGWAQGNRRANIGDFGSGYVIDKVVNAPKFLNNVKRKLVMNQQAANTRVKIMMDPANWTSHHVGG